MPRAIERQLTDSPHGHILTNIGVWSADNQWIVYDVRSDPEGAEFDGRRIECVHVRTGEIQVLFESKHGAACGVATCGPVDDRVVFIHGPEHPTPDWSYATNHRQGVIVRASKPGITANLDARDLVPPFTPGALRGGTHLHVFSGDGQWVSFTYEDQVLERFKTATAGNDINQRNVGVSVPGGPVRVPRSHPRNHEGEYFSVLATRTVAEPTAGSDEIKRAFEEGWVGTNGYLRPDGSRQKRAIAFQGQVVTGAGETISEVFIVDLPDDVAVAGDGPLQGTETRMPSPPRGAVQRRLTFTAERKHPGLQGPRHWLRSSPCGSRIAFLMRDDAGVAQLWTISPNDGKPVQVTRNAWDIASAFSWSPDAKWVAHAMDNSVFVTDMATGDSHRLTGRASNESAPRPEACVFSPDGSRIAYVRDVAVKGHRYNQIFVARVETD